MAQETVTGQIADELRQQIAHGTLGPGALLPSEPELASAHDVSRQTARTALQALEHEGLVIVRPRRGRVVRSNERLYWRLSEFELPDNTGLMTSDAWEADIEAQGRNPTRQSLQVETTHPPHDIAARLNLDADRDLCVVRRRVRYIDDQPTIISDDYFDEEIVRGTELAEDWDTTREDILKDAGHEQTYDIDEIITRMPSPSEGRRLSLAAGEPVAEHTRTGYTASGKAVRLTISIIPGNALILRYVLPT